METEEDGALRGSVMWVDDAIYAIIKIHTIGRKHLQLTPSGVSCACTEVWLC